MIVESFFSAQRLEHNVKKLVEMGFLHYQRSRDDRRSVRVKLTDKGHEVRDIVDALYREHASTVEQAAGINSEEFILLNKSLRRLDRFWVDQVSYRL
jgi:DNA-binding MarR family transcriptional regulator